MRNILREVEINLLTNLWTKNFWDIQKQKKLIFEKFSKEMNIFGHSRDYMRLLVT